MTTGGTALGRYRRAAAAAVAAVYFLILVGATVRASGAGMGCPDWPTCFGRWIPPTSESQLPSDYQEIYADLGYAETRFNAVKTWTEYLNRLTGAAVGLLILAAAALSWPLRRFDRGVFLASAGAFALVCVQGWLGAMVVRSNLLPGMVTAHMAMALAIVAVLLFALERARARAAPAGPAAGPRLEKWLWALLAMIALQVVLGTQVREMTDLIRQAQGEALRSRWIEAMPWFFYVHRSFSAPVLLTGLCLAWLLPRGAGPVRATAAALVAAAASGATLGHLGMPAVAQPLHLLAASALFGLAFILCMRCRRARRLEAEGGAGVEVAGAPVA